MMAMIYLMHPWLNNQQLKQQDKLLEIHSDKPTPTDMDGILRHHKDYHRSSMLGEGPKFCT